MRRSFGQVFVRLIGCECFLSVQFGEKHHRASSSVIYHPREDRPEAARSSHMIYHIMEFALDMDAVGLLAIQISSNTQHDDHDSKILRGDQDALWVSRDVALKQLDRVPHSFAATIMNCRDHYQTSLTWAP